ncbi:MAG: hypothetical protein RLY16_2241, partial [Bacteroidota bacterium]
RLFSLIRNVFLAFLKVDENRFENLLHRIRVLASLEKSVAQFY